MLLSKADVFIRRGVGQGTFDVVATESSYPLVRSVMLTLKSDFGLPVFFHSESMARSLKSHSQYSPNVLVLNTVEVYNEFKFQIVAWRINCGGDKTKELAEEVAQHLRQVGLDVRNQL